VRFPATLWNLLLRAKADSANPTDRSAPATSRLKKSFCEGGLSVILCMDLIPLGWGGQCAAKINDRKAFSATCEWSGSRRTIRCAIRELVDASLQELSQSFDRLYACGGRPSSPPERMLRALLLQAVYTVRSERQLMEQLDYNLLFPLRSRPNLRTNEST
jgi:hypothetical protein